MEFLESLFFSENTLKTYTSLFLQQIQPNLSEEEARDIDIWKVNRLLRKWQAQGLKPSTLSMLLTLLGRYVSYCGGTIDLKPVAKIVRTMDYTKKVNCLTYEEYRIFLRELQKEEDDEFVLAMLFASTAGLRKSEVYNLHERDVDLGTGLITIIKTKAGAARTVKISNLLRIRLKRRNYFSMTESMIFKRRDPNKRLKAFCRRIGVREVSIHGLRHTFATSGLDNDVTLKDMQMTLGHASIKTTGDVYWNHLSLELDVDTFIPEGV